MSLRLKIFDLITTLLRVPPIFVIDLMFKRNFGFSSVKDHTLLGFCMVIGKILFSLTCCLTALFLLYQKQKYLMLFYMYLMSMGTIAASYWMNLNTMKTVFALLEEKNDINAHFWAMLSLNESKEQPEYPMVLLQNGFVQLLLAFIFINTHFGPRNPLLQKFLAISMLIPTFLPILSSSSVLLTYSPVFAALLPSAIMALVFCRAIPLLIDILFQIVISLRNTLVRDMPEIGIWIFPKILSNLRLFWILRAFVHAAIFFNKKNGQTLFQFAKYIMVTGCDTFTALLGITSVVWYICLNIGQIVATENEGPQRRMVGDSVIVFYILALQTGLTGLDPEERFLRLCRNFCLLFLALLRQIHNRLYYHFMSLNASENFSLKRHLRLLAICAFLAFVPFTLLICLWSYHEVSPWSLAVSAHSIEVILKVSMSLAIYSLFLLGIGLDDYVYYLMGFVDVVEFCFGILLFFPAAWFLISESGGVFRTVMLCIHAYYNIWTEAKIGWAKLMKRRAAADKINSLPDASGDELLSLNDICSICHQEMTSAKITRCGHYFHQLCLRRWLYEQDFCPLCNEFCHNLLI